MRILALDFGGSGLKSAVFDNGEMKELRTKLSVPSKDAILGKWIAERFGKGFDLVAIGIPGVVDPKTQKILHAFHPNWQHTYPVQSVRQETGVHSVLLMNDAEAHAYANKSLPSKLAQFTLGSGFGLAILDDDGRFIRPQNGSLDPGQLQISCDLSQPAAWYALSGRGLAEYERRDSQTALAAYAGLVAKFAVGISVMFQIRTFAFSGGILDSYPALVEHIEVEFRTRVPNWYAVAFGMPTLVCCRDPLTVGLRGLAAAAEDAKGSLL